ncbi:MAG: hypothetical protein GC164_02450 [Phycisphaera sp.]|nr:hypothetical protein [Phycisphaera sp.]
MSDQPLDEYRKKLLTVAFETATEIPAYPHIKTRSRMQYLVTQACLQLGQTQPVEKSLLKIENWRRGSVMADLAIYRLQHGSHEGVEKLIQDAQVISLAADQDWRKSEIVSKCVKARILLGQKEQAIKDQTDAIEPMHQGGVASDMATKPGEDSYRAQMQALASVTGNLTVFDTVMSAMGSYLEIYRANYHDDQRRKEIEEQVLGKFEAIPLIKQIDILLEMSAVCAQSGDPAHGLGFVNQAQVKIDSVAWDTEYYIPMIGRLAGARARCGDVDKAREQADAMVRMFDEKHGDIMTFDQAGALRPVAESYLQMSDPGRSLEVYRKVIEVGAINPNARCRAEDLVATCLSLALQGLEPDSQMWTRIGEIKRGLGDPW